MYDFQKESKQNIGQTFVKVTHNINKLERMNGSLNPFLVDMLVLFSCLAQ